MIRATSLKMGKMSAIIQNQNSRQEIRKLFYSILVVAEIISWMWKATLNSYKNHFFGFHPGISFIVNDPTYSPPLSVYKQQTLFGAHFFGDLQGMFLNGAQTNAYGLTSTTQIPPFGNIWASSLYIFGRSATAFLFIVLSLVLPAILILLWEKKSTISSLLIAYCALVLANVTTYNILDRGSMLLIVIPFLGFGLHRTFVLEKFDILAMIFFAIAIGNKPYIACVFVLFVCEGRWLFTLRVAFVTLGLNVLAMLSFQGNVITNFIQLTRALAWFNSQDSIREFSMGQAALFRVWSDLMVHIYGNQKAIEVLTATPHLAIAISMFWIVLITSICAAKHIPLWIRLAAALSTVQLVVAASPPYTRMWVLIVGLSVFQVFTSENRQATSKIDLREMLAGIAITCSILVSSIMMQSYNYSPRVWLLTFLFIRIIYVSPSLKVDTITKSKKFST
jgi:hypothetical protein